MSIDINLIGGRLSQPFLHAFNSTGCILLGSNDTHMMELVFDGSATGFSIIMHLLGKVEVIMPVVSILLCRGVGLKCSIRAEGDVYGREREKGSSGIEAQA